MIETCSYCGKEHETRGWRMGSMVIKECPEYPENAMPLGMLPDDWKHWRERSQDSLNEYSKSHNLHVDQP